MDKSSDDVLQNEILRERAEVLWRAGNSVDHALIRLRCLEESIQGQYRELNRLGDDPLPHVHGDLATKKRQIIKGINENIMHFNKLREYARLRYHYLIITREAMGLRRHQRVDEIYAIPPKKRFLREA
jgi:hypothetical protein